MQYTRSMIRILNRFALTMGALTVITGRYRSIALEIIVEWYLGAIPFKPNGGMNHCIDLVRNNDIHIYNTIIETNSALFILQEASQYVSFAISTSVCVSIHWNYVLTASIHIATTQCPIFATSSVFNTSRLHSKDSNLLQYHVAYTLHYMKQQTTYKEQYNIINWSLCINMHWSLCDLSINELKDSHIANQLAGIPVNSLRHFLRDFPPNFNILIIFYEFHSDSS